MKLFHSILKELKLLGRDRSGLAVVTLMPVALVFVVTLVQEDAFQRIRGATTTILWVDEDGGRFGREAEAALRANDSVTVLTEVEGTPLDRQRCLDLAAGGSEPFCVVIPAGTSEALEARVGELLWEASGGRLGRAGGVADRDAPRPTLFSDPAVQRTLKNSMAASLDHIGQTFELQRVVAALATALGGDPAAFESVARPKSRPPIFEEATAGRASALAMPSSVQQNVPAWSLFAMFLVIIPLSGSLIKERQTGTLTRLRTAPVAPLTVILAKVLAYVLLCAGQFVLMVAIGKFLLPLLGTPRLEMGTDYLAIGLCALCSALAATGLGILIGAVAGTIEQATAFGSAFVVIAAVLGGVMVPVFLMPPAIRPLAAVSPLQWGLSAFMETFLRGGGIREIYPELLKLLALFAAATAGSAWLYARRTDGRADRRRRSRR